MKGRVGSCQLSRKPVLFAINYLHEAKRLAWENGRVEGRTLTERTVSKKRFKFPVAD